jgi:hypothetical protein
VLTIGTLWVQPVGAETVADEDVQSVIKRLRSLDGRRPWGMATSSHSPATWYSPGILSGVQAVTYPRWRPYLGEELAYGIPGSEHAVGVLEEAARVLYGEQEWPALKVAIVSAGLLKRPGVISLLPTILEDGSAPESAIVLAIETLGELPIDGEDLDLIRALQLDRSVNIRMTAFAVDADLTGSKTAVLGFLDEMAYAKCMRDL